MKAKKILNKLRNKVENIFNSTYVEDKLIEQDPLKISNAYLTYNDKTIAELLYKYNILESAKIPTFRNLDELRDMDFGNPKNSIALYNSNAFQEKPEHKEQDIQSKKEINWVAIKIYKDKDITVVQHINATGESMAPELISFIQEKFSGCRIENIFSKNCIEHNHYDNGVMLIYAIHALSTGNIDKFPDIIKNNTDSFVLGQLLRNIYNEGMDINHEGLPKLLRDYRKVIDLQKIDKEYGELLRELTSNDSLEDLVELAHLFKDIADLNIKLGNISGALKYYTDGAIRCQYAKHTIDKIKNELLIKNDVEIQSEIAKLEGDCSDQLQTIHKLIKSVKNSEPIIDISKEVSKDSDEISNKTELEELSDKISNKAELEELRKFTKNKIQDIKSFSIDDHAYINTSREVFETIATKMQGYLSHLYEEAEEAFGESPCKYTVIGLGSMALKQITPYSDLEFAILTENENYKTDPETRAYFLNLTHYVHFKVICLGETTIPANHYNCNLDYLARPAVNFDLGGKTPLGRIDKKKPYDLIKTVDQMLNYLKNENQEAEHIDKNLPYILENTCFIHGNEELISNYQTEVTSFLLSENGNNGQLYCETRAIKMLSTGTTEIDYAGGLSKQYISLGNLYQFEFNPYEAQGKLYDVKQEIYRLPDRLIYNLGLIYGVKKSSAWKTIEELAQREIITEKAANNLSKAVSFATVLRLKTYDHYGYQKEKMDIRDQNLMNNKEISEKIKENVFCLTSKELSEDGALFTYYYAAIPLFESLHNFCEKRKSQDSITDEDKEHFFKKEKFHQDDATNKALINKRLLRDKEALKHLLEELEMRQKSLPEGHPLIAISLHNIGFSYGELGEHKEALDYKLQALKILQKSLPEDHPDIATILHNIGSSYGALGKHKEALEYQLQALEIKQKSLPEDHQDIAISLNNIGSTCGELGKHEEALNYKLKALKILQKSLPKDHSCIAAILNNIGSTYGELGKHEEALKYQLQALKMLQKLLTEDHQFIAKSLNNIGSTYGELGKHKEALDYKLQALKMLQKLLPKEHPDIATSLSNISLSYRAFGKHEEALEYQLQALKMRQKLLPKEHPDIATSLSNIVVSYGELKNYDKALDYILKALEIKKKGYQSIEEERISEKAKKALLEGIRLENLGDKLLKENKSVKKNKKVESEFEKAKGFYQQSLWAFTDISSIKGISLLLNNLEKIYEKLQYSNAQQKIVDEKIRVCNKLYALYQQMSQQPDVEAIGHSEDKVRVVRKEEDRKKTGAKIKSVQEEREVSSTSQSSNNTPLSYKGDINEQALEIRIADEDKTRFKQILSQYEIKCPETSHDDSSHTTIFKVGTEDDKKRIEQEAEKKSIKFLPNNLSANDNINSSREKNSKQATVKATSTSTAVENLQTTDTGGQLSRFITNFEEIPAKEKESVRVVSYNITTDFFDKNDTTEDARHHWHNRAPFVKQLLNKILPDIICLQELSAAQAKELDIYLSKSGPNYKSVFLSQTPGDLPIGTIVQGQGVENWCGKFAGTPLLGNFISQQWNIIEEGRFWLNEKPEEVPEHLDRGTTDKGFGNMNTYRAVLWTKIQNDAKQILFIFNSHYPLSGDNKTRFKCAELEMDMIQKITKNQPWVSSGDRNLIPIKSDNETYNPETAYKELVKFGGDARDANNHFGTSATWIGFLYDKHINKIDSGDFIENSVLDVMVSNMKATTSFCHPAGFNLGEQELIALSVELSEAQNEDRYFASDHALVGADFICKDWIV